MAPPTGSGRWLYLALGCLLLALGVAGMLLPVMPGTVFLLAALACFSRGSPRLAGWLLAHPQLGAPLRRWQATRCIPLAVKWLACLSMLAGFLLLASRPLATVLLCLASSGIMAGMASVLWQRHTPHGSLRQRLLPSLWPLGGFWLLAGWLICQRPLL